MNPQSVSTEVQTGLPSADKSPLGPLELQTTSIWSFPDRGSWGPHNGSYRGNWSPHIPRNLILRYTAPGDVILDPMVGGGTTLIECLVLGRNGVGLDVNPEALLLARSQLVATRQQAHDGVRAQLYHGDARELAALSNDSIDLATLHPPYADMIRYSQGRIKRDLSSISNLAEFFAAIGVVAKEIYRVLKPGKHCAVLMGDTRRRGHLVPLSFHLFQEFLNVGYVVREHIIKLQWNTTSERTTWAGKNCSFYKIAHEHLFVFRKPLGTLDLQEHALSQRLR